MMKRSLVRWWAVVALGVMLMGGARAQGEAPLVPGSVHPTVECAGYPGESYALYLPANYDPATRWPVVYFFEPAARGSLPVEKYRTAAEAFGTILIGSNTSRNYNNEVVLKAAEAMWADSRRRLAIDPERVAFCGFSGGARVSASLAGLRGGVRGVIGFGAGYQAEDPNVRQHPFLYFAAVGMRDMNYLELQALDRKLDRLEVTHRIVTFDDGHDWPPADVFREALEWLQIHDMKAGRVPRDDTWLATVFAARLERAGEMEKDGRLLAALKENIHLVTDFEGVVDIAEAQQAADRLQSEKEVQKAARRELELLRFEEEMYAELLRRFSQLRGEEIDREDLDDALKWWQKKVKELQSMARRDKEPEKQLIAERMLSYVNLRGYEEAVHYARGGDHVKMALVLRLQLLIDSRAPYAHFNLGCAYARLDDSDAALKHLELAVEYGFDRVDILAKNEDLDKLRQTPRFQKILDKARGQ
jgi:pimeloyl-ACP methyl ester carboxylesterase